MAKKRISISSMKPGDPPQSFELPGPMKKPCANCPFVDPVMQMSLGEERLSGIKDHVAGGGFFPCHKTIDYDKQEEAHEKGFDYDIDEVLNRRECAGAVAHKNALK